MAYGAGFGPEFVSFAVLEIRCLQSIKFWILNVTKTSLLIAQKIDKKATFLLRVGISVLI